MPDPSQRPSWIGEVEAALSNWRQGDCTLGTQELFYRFDPARPVSPGALEIANEDGDEGIAAEEVRGLVVLTQTCDIRRDPLNRPYLEVGALVEVKPERMHEVERRLQPRFAYIRGVAQENLVADLDRTMVVEKPVVAGWERIAGFGTWEEERRFAEAVARKHARAAFSNEFVAFVDPLRERLKARAGKASPEGRAVDSLREIRVVAPGGWDDPEVPVHFYFIRRPASPEEFEGKRIGEFVEEWLALLDGESRSANGQRFDASGRPTMLEDMTAAEFVASDPLDLDNLSS